MVVSHGIFDPVLDFVRHSSTMEMAWKLGLVTGAANHFTCQYPHQVDLMTSLGVYGVANLFFCGTIFIPGHQPTFTGTLLELSTFNAIYLSLSALLKILYNVFFRHGGIPTTFRMSATDWWLWTKYRDGTAMKAAGEMHDKLGS
jgi:hypothetical protein